MKRRTLLASVAVTGATPSLSAVATSRPRLREPTGVHVAYGRDATGAIRVGWSGPPALEAYVEYGDGDGDGPPTRVQARATVLPGEDTVAYAATITGLDPGRTYEYRVGLDGTTSATHAVETAPEAPESFTVTAVGDHGVDDPQNPFQRVDTETPRRVLQRAAAEGADLHICHGDISYANGHPSTWDYYFDSYEEFYASRPFMTVPGNHEAEPGLGLTQYDARLNRLMPTPDTFDADSPPRWHHFRYGNAVFVGLNTTTDACGDVGPVERFVPFLDPRCRTENERTVGNEQKRYLRRVLRAADRNPAVQWKVVYSHGPLYTGSDVHASREDLQDQWGPLFDRYDVDVVLSGDNHVYERTKPIRAESARTVGTTYLVNGTGGTSHYETDPAEFLAVSTNEHFGVTRLDIDDRRIRVRYVDVSGTVVDGFDVVKTPEGPTQSPIVDHVADPLRATGSREDDVDAVTAGAQKQVALTVSASERAVVRDRLPPEWTVVRTENGEPVGDATRATVVDGAREVRFGSAVAEASTRTFTYVVRAPDDPAETGVDTLGPAQARGPRGDWVDVTGTTERVIVVGVAPPGDTGRERSTVSFRTAGR